MSVRAAADTHGLGVDQGLECRDMTGSTTRLLLMLTTPSDCLGSHMISNDWSWSESLGAKALKNGPLWPFLWVRELSGEEQLMQLFVLYNFFLFIYYKKKINIYICAASSAFTAFSATSSLIPSSRDLSEPLEASGPEEPPVSARLQFGRFSIRRSPLKKKNICFSHMTYFMNGAMHHWTLTYRIYNPRLRESNMYGCVSALNTLHIICLLYPSKYSAYSHTHTHAHSEKKGW